MALWVRLCVAVACGAVGAGAAECMVTGQCEGQVSQVVEDIRELIADRMQAKADGVFSIAPAAIRITESKFRDGMLNTDMRNASQEAALLEHFWYQMQQMEDLGWVYFGVEATGAFVSLRRSWACEVTKTCDYEAERQPQGDDVPTITKDTIVRVLTTPESSHTTIQAWPTAAATGSDPVGTQYLYEDSYDMRNRPWYTTRKASQVNGTVWEQPYVWTGGILGITAMHRVEDARGRFMGVLAADYELSFLNRFLDNIDVERGTVLYIVAANGDLVATNLGIDVLDEFKTIKVAVEAARDSEIIAATAEDIFSELPNFADAEADWTDLVEKVHRGAKRLADGTKIFWDAVGILGLRWTVVVATPESMKFAVTPSELHQCVTKIQCREVILRAHLDMRMRQILFFKELAAQYLSVPNTVINFLEAAYNNGELHASACTACGPLEWANTADIALLKKHMRSLLDIFAEPAWLYMGFNERKVVGYRRGSGGELELWQTCDGTPEGCTDGTAFWRDADRTQLVAALPEDVFWTRMWWKLPDKVGLGPDQTAWTDAYRFSDDDVGVTYVKRAYNGDWQMDRPIGVFASDITMLYFTEVLGTMDVQENTVLYIMDTQANLHAANKGIEVQRNGTLLKATESSHNLVRESANSITRATYGPTTDFVYSVLGMNDTDRWAVDAIRFRDPDQQAVRKSYDFYIVMVTPEVDMYDITFSAAGGGAASLAAVAASVVAVFVQHL